MSLYLTIFKAGIPNWVSVKSFDVFIISLLFSITLVISGGHLVSTNLKLHHYSDEDYKGIFYLKNNDSITKHCLKHSELEDIKKIRHQRHNNGENTTVTDYKVTKNEEKEILEEMSKEVKS